MWCNGRTASHTRLFPSEELFGKTLGRGLAKFERVAAKLPKGGAVSGEKAFELYATYGFPPDLTGIMAEEKGLTVDKVRASFARCLLSVSVDSGPMTRSLLCLSVSLSFCLFDFLCHFSLSSLRPILAAY
jgi:hypothetical protein